MTENFKIDDKQMEFIKDFFSSWERDVFKPRQALKLQTSSVNEVAREMMRQAKRRGFNVDALKVILKQHEERLIGRGEQVDEFNDLVTIYQEAVEQALAKKA